MDRWMSKRFFPGFEGLPASVCWKKFLKWQCADGMGSGNTDLSMYSRFVLATPFGVASPAGESDLRRPPTIAGAAKRIHGLPRVIARGRTRWLVISKLGPVPDPGIRPIMQ